MDYIIPPGNQLEVKKISTDNSGTDIWFAYDTTDYPSRIEFP
ncbi:hypothetical protein ACFLYL_03365 [Chloroflexota bacterium]